MRARTTFPAMLAVLLATALLYACGGGSDGGSANSATVSAYVTDDLGGYDSVTLTVNSVQLRHTSGRNCEIIHGPLTFDAAELGRDDLVDYVDTTICEPGPYNRLYVELDDDVTLRHTDANQQPVTDQCKFASYYEDRVAGPNRLNCANGVCSLNITGAVNLVAGNHEHVALDVDLKEFEVTYPPNRPCEVTLKVSPLHADDKLAAGYRMSLAGQVSNLNITDDRFILTTALGAPYLVQYAGVTDQTGLDALLTRAAADQLRTRVRCDAINTTTTPPTCTTSSDVSQPLKAITVLAAGTVSGLNSSLQTLALNYGTVTTMPVNYAKATELGEVFGTLANDVDAAVRLYGFSLDYFLARRVVVQQLVVQPVN